MHAGMIRKMEGIYVLTSFGRLMLGVQRRVEKAAEMQWKLKAIDQLEMSHDIPEEERAKLIAELVGDGNQEMKDELLKSHQTTKAAAKDDQPRRRRREPTVLTGQPRSSRAIVRV